MYPQDRPRRPQAPSEDLQRPSLRTSRNPPKRPRRPQEPSAEPLRTFRDPPKRPRRSHEPSEDLILPPKWSSKSSHKSMKSKSHPRFSFTAFSGAICLMNHMTSRRAPCAKVWVSHGRLQHHPLQKYRCHMDVHSIIPCKSIGATWTFTASSPAKV